MTVESRKEIIIETDKRMEKIAGAGVSWSPEQVAIIKNTVAKKTTDLELAYFLNVCEAVKLNPFLKEIWCYKDNKGNLLVFTGRDGFLSKAQTNKNYGGIRSCEIREKDEFSVDVANKEIHHKITEWGSARGKIRGAYAIVFRKDGEPTIEIADFETYNKGRNTWASHPAEMIKKVAEAHALKKAMGITGLQVEDAFDIKDGVAVPMSLTAPKTLLQEVEHARKDLESEISDEDFLREICKKELEQDKASTVGQKNHVMKMLFTDKKYDLKTGDLIIEVVETTEPPQPDMPAEDLIV